MLLLVDYGKVLCSLANEIQQKLKMFCSLHFILLTYWTVCVLPVVRKQ